jgi:hypothetical protein
MTDPPQNPESPQPERIKEITQTVIDFLSKLQESQKKPPGLGEKMLGAVNWLCDHWVLVLAFFSIITVGSLCLYHWVNPLYSLSKEIQDYKQKQDERKFTERIVKWRLQCGNELLNAGLNEEAKKEFEAVQNLDKTNIEAQLGLLKSKVFELSQGEYEPEVIEKRIKFIEKEKPNDPHVYLFRGRMLNKLKKYSDAKENLKNRMILMSICSGAGC